MQNKPARTKAVYKNTVFILACLPSVIVSSLRFDVGTDYGWVYWVGYLGVMDHPDNVTIARSYKPMCQFLNIFSESPIPFFVISSCLILTSIFWYIRQTNERITLPVLLFFISGLFFDSMNVIRQYMAFAVWLFAYPSMRDRKLWQYLLISMIAVLVHPTAVILLPFYFLYRIKLTKHGFIAAGLLFVVVAVAGRWLIPLVLVHIPKYSRYVTWNPDPELAGTVFAVLLTATTLVLYDRLPERENRAFLLWALLFYDGTVILSYFLPQMGRVMQYFTVPLFLNLIPLLLDTLTRFQKKFATCAVICFFFLSTTYSYYYLGHAEVFPYKTVFEVERMDEYMVDSDDVLELFLQEHSLG